MGGTPVTIVGGGIMRPPCEADSEPGGTFQLTGRLLLEPPYPLLPIMLPRGGEGPAGCIGDMPSVDDPTRAERVGLEGPWL